VRVERERLERERVAREQEEKERLARVDRERGEREARERAACELAARERADQERAARARAEPVPVAASSAGRGASQSLASERCIIYRTPEVEDSERALRWSLVAYVTGTRRSVSSEAATAALLSRFPELDGHISVHRFWPAEFLIVFDSRSHRDSVADVSPVEGRGFSLRCSPWNRQLQATRHSFRYRAHLEIIGIPPIAWNVATVRSVLGPSAWVERIGVETATRADMGRFRVTAWTDNLASLPRVRQMWLAEPLLYGEDNDDLLAPPEALVPEEVGFLEFNATVHLVRLEDTMPSIDWPAPGGSMDDDGSGGGTGGDSGRADDVDAPRGARSERLPDPPAPGGAMGQRR
jgi:hypothetical protein